MADQQPQVGLILTGLLLGLILSSLDQTIVATAMPTVVKELGGLAFYSWVFSIYMLASTATMPIYGKLADLWGRRKVYLTGLAIFLAGSILCGFAGTMVQLIVFRGIQGIGAGALMPVAFTIIGDILPPEKRGKFMGTFGAVFAVSSILGPALGGVIAQHWDWSWIFYINLPIGILAFYLIAKAMKESKIEGKPSIDWLGAAVMCGAVISILLALVLGGSGQESGELRNAWGSPQITGLLAAGIFLLVLFVWIETKAKEPILPLHLFKIRTITFGNIAGFFMSAGMFGAITYIPLFAQGVIGVSPSAAGYILTPMMLAVAVTSTFSGQLMKRFSYRTILLASLALMACGFMMFSQMTVDTALPWITVYMIITGLGMGAVYPALGTAAQTAVDWNYRGVATSSNQFFRSIGGTIGVSALGSLLAQQMMPGLHDPGAIPADYHNAQLQQLTNPQVLLDPAALAALPPEVVLELQKTFSHSLNTVFAAGLGFVAVSFIACVFLGNARLIQASKG